MGSYFVSSELRSIWTFKIRKPGFFMLTLFWTMFQPKTSQIRRMPYKLWTKTGWAKSPCSTPTGLSQRLSVVGAEAALSRRVRKTPYTQEHPKCSLCKEGHNKLSNMAISVASNKDAKISQMHIAYVHAALHTYVTLYIYIFFYCNHIYKCYSTYSQYV